MGLGDIHARPDMQSFFVSGADLRALLSALKDAGEALKSLSREIEGLVSSAFRDDLIELIGATNVTVIESKVAAGLALLAKQAPDET